MSIEARRLAAYRAWRDGFGQTLFTPAELDLLMWEVATLLLR